MRTERDRFVAFAFCSADVLVQLDENHVVTFAAGATAAFFGSAPAALIGRPFLQLVAEKDRALVGELLHQARGRGRFEDVAVTIEVGAAAHNLAMSGYRLKELGGDFFVGLRPMRGRPISDSEHGPFRDEETSLYDADSFSHVVQQRLNDNAGDNCLTVIELDGGEELRGRLDGDEWADLHRSISACMRAVSICGDTAGLLGVDRYGLLHGPDADIGALGERIETAAREADPAGVGVNVLNAPIVVDDQALSDVEAAKALVYTIQQVTETPERSVTLSNLNEELASQLADTTRMMLRAKSAVEEHDFRVELQPIVNLDSREVHHYEALVRLADDQGYDDTFAFIRFAEDTGLITQFDKMMCAEVIRAVAQLREAGVEPIVAVNLSGRSIDTPNFMDDLLSMLKSAQRENGVGPDQLMFEVTESYRIRDLKLGNAAIQRLRQQGFKVCIDDFGVGEAAFEYLRAFEIDFVKIDGSYVEYAKGDPRGKAFLVNMAALCRDVGVTTIAERIEESSLVPFLKACGIAFGQGFLFGAPKPTEQLIEQASAPQTTDQATTSLNLRRRGAVDSWG